MTPSRAVALVAVTSLAALACSASSPSGAAPDATTGARPHVDATADTSAHAHVTPHADAHVTPHADAHVTPHPDAGPSDAARPADASPSPDASADAHAIDAARAKDAADARDASPDARHADATTRDATSGHLCDQTILPYPLPPATAHLISPRRPVTPFYQWENNDGYCGEVSLIQAGLNNGEWLSQWNARLLCGAYLEQGGVDEPALQSGPDGWCGNEVEGDGGPYEYAQLLFTCPTGCAAAATCLSNAALEQEEYQTPDGHTGRDAYEAYMSWVKQKVIDGDWVTVGILWAYGDDDEYDHIVSVTGIGTNHDPTDPTYYPDDVLMWDDHGLYTFNSHGTLASNPAIPHGADTPGCTPYLFSDTFENLSRGRADMPDAGEQPYAFPLPTRDAHNYAFAVKGPADDAHETLPAVLRITGTTTDGTPNPVDPRAGYNYENPFIGTSVQGTTCTNTPPTSWMQMTADVTVEGLTSGVDYVLYEYDFDSVSGLLSAAALAVPTSAFNANAAMATHATPFTATGATYVQSVAFPSNRVVVFRAVPASGG